MLVRDRFYFVQTHSDSTKKFSETDIKILEFLIDNIFVMFGGCVFKQTVGIPVGTNCTPFLDDLFFYSNETGLAGLILWLLKKNETMLA